MRIFKTKPFARFASREGIADEELCEAAYQAERGLIDADLGGGVIKQRLAREGQGKSGGFRSIVLFRRGSSGRNDERNDHGDRVPWVRSIAATRWRRCTRPRSVSPRRAS